MELCVKDLHFGFHKKEILQSINLSVKSGEFVGILGPNGCGKSTLLKNILQIYTPNSGAVMLDDKNIAEFSQKELARMIGFVPQKSGLTMPLRVKDIVIMGRYSYIDTIFSGYSDDDYKKMDEILKTLNLDEFKERIAFSLSGGEFGRVMLARALIGEPKVLLLDEPTAALDLNYAISILEICANLIKKLQIIGVIVIHDLNLATLFCDRVLMLKDGKVAYNGTPNELFTKEILKEIYDLDCEIITHNEKPFIIPTKKEIL